jgi:hypothetical protein
MENPYRGLCIIDRFEEDYAVIELEGRTTFDLPRSLLPEGAAEGDVLIFDVKIDREETKRRQEQSEAMLRAIMKTED